MSRGFTLIELLVVLAIIAIIASIIATIINPLEIARRARDATRLTDLANLQIAINILIQENPKVSTSLLCHSPSTPPCSGTSIDPGSRNSDGTGWVKVEFDPLASGIITASSLPADPLNTGEFVYSYATNRTGDKWEINATLESEKEKIRMSQDGGNNLQKYEIGLSLDILN